jgi:hypothetical protein
LILKKKELNVLYKNACQKHTTHVVVPE